MKAINHYRIIVSIIVVVSFIIFNVALIYKDSMFHPIISFIILFFGIISLISFIVGYCGLVISFIFPNRLMVYPNAK